MVLGRVHEERRLEEDGTNFNKRSKNPNARRTTGLGPFAG